jgi:regulator of protease activity HflC (stomatin/prohibitin superfamily)
MSNVNSVSALIFIILLLLSFGAFSVTGSYLVLIIGFLIAILVSSSVRIANQWEKAVVLKLGRFHGLRGPGLFLVVPIINTIPDFIDMRVITSTFTAEETLTKDNVPVDVDGVLFWEVEDAQKAAINVQDYKNAVNTVAQTTLRDIIGKTPLADILSGREEIDKKLKLVIDSKTEPWGINVQNVEIREIRIPKELQDAMSRNAQAERERQARIILADSEVQTAAKFKEAARIYGTEPIHLRGLNLLYEATKEKGTFIIIPSTAANIMGTESLSYVALAEVEKLKKEKEAQEASKAKK